MYGDIGTYLKAWSSFPQNLGKRESEDQINAHLKKSGGHAPARECAVKSVEGQSAKPGPESGRSFYIDPSYIIRSAAPAARECRSDRSARES